jgi:hypothetical protein
MYAASNGNDPIGVTIYDVVAIELPGQGYIFSEEYNGQQQQIGNNRFNVLIDIHAESFNTNKSAHNRDECDKIVETIWDATSGKKDRHSISFNPNGGCGVSCNNNRGRFLVMEMTDFDDPDDINWQWRELDEKSCKQLIVQTLMSRIEERRKDLFESEILFDGIGFGTEGFDTSFNNNSNINSNINNNNTVGSRPPRLRRSRSASNMMLDANNAFHQLLNFPEVISVDEDLFEPLPINSSLRSHEVDHCDPDGFGNTMNDELNNRRCKKRERRRSLLRRSNSFESLFDNKKKIFKDPVGDLPPFLKRRSVRRQPSFIRCHNPSFTDSTGVVDPSGGRSSVNFMSRAINYATSIIPEFASSSEYHDDSQNSGEALVVSASQGLDIVLLDDRKTLSTTPTILGNNRLRILLKLERGRFLVLSPAEQQKTATDLVRTITEDWKGRILMEYGTLYNVLGHEDATDAMYWLLFGGENSTSNNNNNNNSSIQDSRTSSYAASSSLLKAPPLPDFLIAASKDILSVGTRKSLSQMTASERQAVAIEALKERNKSRQLAKEKAENS